MHLNRMKLSFSSLQNLEKALEGRRIKYCLLHSQIILIAFENTIRLSADILIASAHALIVFVSATNKTATKRKHTPPQSLFFCCHAVTLSHFEHN